MRYLSFVTPEKSHYPVVLLVPSIRKDDIRKTYIEPFGFDDSEFLVIQSHHTPNQKKTNASEMKTWITEELLPVLEDMGTRYVVVSDSGYFKTLTKAAKVEPHLGYVMPSVFGAFNVIYVPSYQSVIYDPEKVTAKISTAMNALSAHRTDAYSHPGKDVIRFAAYPNTDQEILGWLEKLLAEYTVLSADIEAFSLKHYDAGIGTITLCWNQGEGISFPIDYVPHNPEFPTTSVGGTYGFQQQNDNRRHMLHEFFIACYDRNIKLMWHNIGYDVYVLIYQLFMDHLLDQRGLLYGIEILLGDQGNWDCTKLITYLATNSCAGNDLRLKAQAQEFAGNYAMEEIKDIRKIPLPVLLEYNLVDGLSTWFTYNKHWDTLVADQQLEIYKEVFQPAMVDIIQMQLTGMPVNIDRVLEVQKILTEIEDQSVQTIQHSLVVQHYIKVLRRQHVDKRNAKLKKKQITLADPEVDAIVFNPNSNPQLQELLYEELGLPVLTLTDAKQPSCDGDTLKALVNHTKDPMILEFLSALIDYKAVNKIITDFIPSLLNAQQGNDGWHYLFGNFNLGGTKSGRLSSSGPNLQNLPANVVMILSEFLLRLFAQQLSGMVKGNVLSLGKLIKSCFEAPPGWIFCGLDFDSLEDRISALTTKDPNKLKVYTDGYDGHCLRAYSYFGDNMPDIDPTSVVSINSIADKYKPERQDSKAPTFALTYQGTWSTLVKNCGFTEDKAKQIEAKYHELYHVSDTWVADKLNQATQDGYVTLAFGLRLRTPLLHQVIRGNSKTPAAAEAEGRTAGNALGQSYCMLNSRAGSEFMGKVRKSIHRNSIKPCSQIHDAGYFLIEDCIEAIVYANKHLVTAVQWQKLPEIAHPQVKLGGSLGIFYPNWTTEITLPNGAEEDEILDVIQDHLSKTQKKAA